MQDSSKQTTIYYSGINRNPPPPEVDSNFTSLVCLWKI